MATEREKISKVTYGATGGDKWNNTPTPTDHIVRHTFADGTTDDFDTNSVSAEIKVQAMLRGFNEKLHNAFASAKGNVAEAIEMYMTVRENLENGIWATKREGSGPRISLLLQAVERALTDAGQVVDDVRRGKIAEKLRTEEGRDVAMKDPQVQKHYADIKAERAKAAAAEAAKNAKGQKSTLGDAF